MSKGNIAKVVLFLLLALGVQTSAMAEGIRLKAGVAMMSYKNPYGTMTNPLPDYKISGPALVLGGSYVFTDVGMFVDVSYRSLMGSPKWNAAEINNNAFPDQPGKLSDQTITVGKMLADGYFAFTGYQSQLDKHGLDDPAFGYSVHKSVTTSGFFLGAGKAISLGSGWLTPTGALAMMGQDMSASDTLGWSDSYHLSPGLGYSMGLSYSYPLNESFDITGEGKYQVYNPHKSDAANVVTTYGINLVGKL